jgi:hypothetical protein
VGRRSFGDDDVAGVSNDRDPIRVQQLTIAFAAFTELELESPLLVENLKYKKSKLKLAILII